MNWTDQSGDILPTKRWLGVAQRLLADIEGGVYEPGDPLPPDRSLAPEFQVGRGTIREALLALELIGALELRQGSGTFVRERWGRLHPDLAGSRWPVEPETLIEARRTVEPSVIAQACERASDGSIQQLRNDLEQAARLVSKQEAVPRFVGLGLQFHANLAELSDNRLLAGIVHQLVDLGSQPMWVLLNQHALSSQEAREHQIDEHRQIVDGIERRDIDRVQAAIASHLDGLRDTIFKPQLITGASAHAESRPKDGEEEAQ